MEKFRQKKDLLKAKRNGDTLYEIYQELESSTPFLQKEGRSAFDILNEALLSPLTKELVAELVQFPTNTLSVSSPSISPSFIKTLVRFKGKGLFLNGLQEMDEKTVIALAQFQGETLSLNGLKAINASIANILIQFQGKELSLNGLIGLDEETSKVLSEFQGLNLSLNGLCKMDAFIGKALARFPGEHLYLNGLQKINEKVAKSLAPYCCKYLHLDGLQKISKAVANAFVQFNGKMYYVKRMKKFCEEPDGFFSEIKKNNSSEFQKINGIIQIFENYAGIYISLKGLQTLEDSSAEILAELKGSVITNKNMEEQIKKYRRPLY